MTLAAVLERHPSEVQADFLRFYQVSDFRTLPMRRAADLAAVMVKQPESWTRRAILGPAARWDNPLVPMVADLLDVTSLGVWLQTEDGHKNRNRPAPYPRPVSPDTSTSSDETVALTIDDLEMALAKQRKKAT